MVRHKGDYHIRHSGGGGWKATSWAQEEILEKMDLLLKGQKAIIKALISDNGTKNKALKKALSDMKKA